MTRRAIVSTPDTCGGKPRIDGTRITVSAVCSFWNDGYSVDRILAEYPSLTADDVVCAVAYDVRERCVGACDRQRDFWTDCAIDCRKEGDDNGRSRCHLRAEAIEEAAAAIAALPLEPEQE